ncbi:MAG TPA: GAF domain-containing protein, partial [Bryobacteraceae bacterium]|nr:GAF domain-containing protein [Bryobacteraceae bacterium]
MAADAIAGVTRRARVAHAALLLCALTAGAPAQPTVRLDQVNARRPGDFSPVLEGRSVAIEAVVAAPAAAIGDYSHLPIQDDSGRGAFLEGSGRAYSALHAGDRIAVRGVVAKRAGMPVIVSSQIEVLSRGTPPVPHMHTPRDLQRFDRLGLLVTTEGRVVERGENTGGEYLLIGDLENPLKVFLPVERPASGKPRFERIEAGDKVRITGVASQYCPLPPFDRYFQIVVTDDEAVVLVQKRWLIAPETFAFCLGALALALAFWWMRERRMSAQRKMVRTFYSLGEQMTGASTASDVVHRLRAVLLAEMKLAGVNLYLYNRTGKTLDRVRSDAASEPFSVPVYGPEDSLPVGPAVCFRNQALLAIGDTRRSPFFPDGRPEGRPRSVIFIPMFAEAALVGVLELYDSQTMADFSADEKILAQHLANQIAIALRLMEEKSIREQLFRSEKLAAMGRLISGVAEELRAPIENICSTSDSLAAELPGAQWNDLRSI